MGYVVIPSGDMFRGWHGSRSRHTITARFRANGLLAGGLELGGDAFRSKLRKYARELEAWRTTALFDIKQKLKAMAATPDPAATLH